MKLIVGLGNPGSRYQKTRHNVGQWAVAALADASKVKSKMKSPSRLNARSAFPNVKLVKTNIFMNESGKEIKPLITNYKLLITNLLIAHDDLDLDPGRWKLQFNRSAAGHKGVQSIIDELGTQGFWRLRIGIGKPSEGKTANQFVVEKPSADERKLIETAIQESLPRVLTWAEVK